MRPSLRFDSLVMWMIVLMLAYSAVIFLAAYSTGADIGSWVWDRHQHQFSWYSRPLFIIPAAYYAYRQKLWHVIGFIALLGTSLFWFPAPASVSPMVSEYLQWEEQFFFSNDNKLPLILLIVAVFVFLFSLFYALWQRNVWIGLAIINAGTILKVIVSFTYGQEAGIAAVVPSLSSLVVINLFAWFLWRRHHRTTRSAK